MLFTKIISFLFLYVLYRNQQSQSSLNSKQSVETVITLEQLMSRQSVNSNSKKNNEQRLRASASKRNVPESDYSLDTDDEVQRLKQSSYFPRNDAEGSEANSDPQPQRAAIQDPSWVSVSVFLIEYCTFLKVAFEKSKTIIHDICCWK